MDNREGRGGENKGDIDKQQKNKRNMENLGIVLIGFGLLIAVLGLRNAVDSLKEKVASKLERIDDLLCKIRDNTDKGHRKTED